MLENLLSRGLAFVCVGQGEGTRTVHRSRPPNKLLSEGRPVLFCTLSLI